jgi:hypothetical protein
MADIHTSYKDIIVVTILDPRVFTIEHQALAIRCHGCRIDLFKR